MKQSLSPAVAGIIIAVVAAIALFLVYRGTGGVAKINEPQDMKKFMGQAAPPKSGAPGSGPPAAASGGQNR